MGTVYEARQAGSDERVAVKALAPMFSFDERFRNRFEGEIEALLRLEHENIVRLLSYGQDDGNLFFAMELVDGNSLFVEQKKGQVFHWREIINIGRQVCLGLRHAHERGIIHRDLKPGNLMIDREGRVKITDFGIAKSFGSASVTSEGNVVGTMDFMAPEQARGQPVTARSDIFSLGAVLYALLAGRPPFLQDTMEKTFESLLSNRPPERLDRIATDTPQPLAALIHRLLEKDPARRIATALAVGRQLELVEESVRGSVDSDTQVVPEATDREVEPGGTFVSVVNSTDGESTSISAFSEKAAAGESNRESTSASDHADDAQASLRQPDYFNQVTPQLRKRSVAGTSESAQRGVVPLVAALIAVVALTIFGVWLVAFRKPDAETLLATIRASRNTPTRVQNEIRTFLAHWPDHAEAALVSDLKDYADAIRFRNTLAVRSRYPNQELSAIQRQFLDITDPDSAEAPEAAERMRQFLAVYRDTSRLSEDDARTIENARVFAGRLFELAEVQIRLGEANLEELFLQAERAASNKDSVAIHKFIIDLYGNDQWASEQVEKARRELERLEKVEKGSLDQ